jgi:hypothetical protein
VYECFVICGWLSGLLSFLYALKFYFDEVVLGLLSVTDSWFKCGLYLACEGLCWRGLVVGWG